MRGGENNMSKIEVQFTKYTQMSGVTCEFHEPTETELESVRKKHTQTVLTQGVEAKISSAVAMADKRLGELVKENGGKMSWSK